MKKENHVSERKPSVIKYFIISFAVFFTALIVSIAVDYALKRTTFSDNNTNYIQGIIAAIATGLVLYQLKSAQLEQEEKNNIEEARSLMQANQFFLQDRNMSYVQDRIEQRIFYHKEKEYFLIKDISKKAIISIDKFKCNNNKKGE